MNKVIESRCGIKCSDCPTLEKYGVDCPGCVGINNPFWGECDVKKCCEAKNLDNCGQCEDFPCETLVAYANHPDEGDGGARIETCKIWCGLTKS